MSDRIVPVKLPPLKAAPYFIRFFIDPIRTLRKIHALHGPFVMTIDPRRTPRQNKMVILGVGARFNREVLSDPDTWRTSSPLPRAPKNSAGYRLRYGLVRLGGAAHAYYRRILMPPLQRKCVDALGDDMLRSAEEEISLWSTDRPIDLVAHANTLMQTIAISMLFGNDRQHGFAVAAGIQRIFAYKWSVSVSACPIAIMGTPYHRMLRDADELERAIIVWADSKRGLIDSRDLMSIVANNPDENGQPISNSGIVGHVPTLLGAAYETCQSVLVWTLVLLDQHPDVARDLVDEIEGHLLGAAPTWSNLSSLPLLDSVVKESMRLLPPVPIQTRTAIRDTTLAGVPVKYGWRVVLSPLLTNRNPDIYPQPDRFLPERWGKIDPTPFEYSVFSAGPRLCIGYWFGLAALKTTIATILTRFRPSIVPNTKVDFRLRVAMSPRRGIPIVLQSRGKAFSAAPLRGAFRDLVQLPN